MSDNEEIVVVGVVADNIDIFEAFLHSTGRSYMPAVVDDGVGSGGGGDPTGIFDMLKDFVKFVLEKVFSSQLEYPERIAEQENALAQTFEPNNVRATSTYTTSSGRTGKIWIMSDGTNFWDTNGNGKPDIQTKFALDGSLWGNDGSGWRALD